MLLVILFVGIVIWFLCVKKGSIERYRDPIYLNRAKYAYDIYPRANGSIYGLGWKQKGSLSIFSGHPYYDRAY